MGKAAHLHLPEAQLEAMVQQVLTAHPNAFTLAHLLEQSPDCIAKLLGEAAKAARQRAVLSAAPLAGAAVDGTHRQGQGGSSGSRIPRRGKMPLAQALERYENMQEYSDHMFHFYLPSHNEILGVLDEAEKSRLVQLLSSTLLQKQLPSQRQGLQITPTQPEQLAQLLPGVREYLEPLLADSRGAVACCCWPGTVGAGCISRTLLPLLFTMDRWEDGALKTWMDTRGFKLFSGGVGGQMSA